MLEWCEMSSGGRAMHEIPVMSEALVKSVLDIEAAEGTEVFRKKMIIALSQYEMASKGISQWKDIVGTPYDDVKHGYVRKMKRWIGDV